MKLLIVSLLFFSFTLAQAPSSCVYTSPSGSIYDLSPLTYDSTQSAPSEYSITGSTGSTMSINICGPVSNVTFPDCTGDGACQESTGYYYSGGTASSFDFQGDQCKNNIFLI